MTCACDHHQTKFTHSIVNRHKHCSDQRDRTGTMKESVQFLANSKIGLNCTGGPRYIREIGTTKIGSHITNSHIKRPRTTVNQRIGSRKEAISGSHIRKIADKKTAYNEGCLYSSNNQTYSFHLTVLSPPGFTSK